MFGCAEDTRGVGELPATAEDNLRDQGEEERTAAAPDDESGDEAGVSEPDPAASLQSERMPLGTVGNACAFGGPGCSANETCVDAAGAGGGRCMCDPGLVVCGTTCYDLANDANNCGACGRACGHLGSCNMGICGSYTPPNGTINTALRISGGDVTQECWKQGEAVPARSLSTGAGTNLILSYMARSHDDPDNVDHYWNVATNWDTWDGGVHLTPDNIFNAELEADPWATSHGGTGLEYLSVHGWRASTNEFCHAEGAATFANLQSTDPDDDFDYPGFEAICIDPIGDPNVDGPSMIFDPGSFGFYTAHADQGGNTSYLSGSRDCFGGQLGGGGCPKSIDDAIFGMNGTFFHPVVAVNPCTHHPMALRRNLSTGTVYLHIWTTKGDAVGSSPYEITVANHVWPSECADLEPVKQCGPDTNECGSGQCIRADRKPILATKYVSTGAFAGNCYAYVATMGGCAGNNRRKSKFVVVDITDEFNVTPILETRSSACGNAAVDFNAGVATNYFTNDVMFYHYRQTFIGGGPCNTSVVAHGSNQLGIGLYQLQYMGPLSTTFPTIKALAGMSDYIAPVLDGLPGGWMFATWSQPVTTTATCIPCQGVEKSLAVYGTRLNP